MLIADNNCYFIQIIASLYLILCLELSLVVVVLATITLPPTSVLVIFTMFKPLIVFNIIYTFIKKINLLYALHTITYADGTVQKMRQTLKINNKKEA